MIVAETPAVYRFVTQPDHARLAGGFADAWGGDRFDRPEPRAPVLAATYVHDDGWANYDRRPHLDADGAPVDFTDMPAATWIDLYGSGIEAAVTLDPYVGLLVSMHGAGLRRRRYGLSPDWPTTPAPFEGFVDREEARQRELASRLEAAGDRIDGADRALLEALHATGSPPRNAASRLWTNYARLQAWDALSLACCRSTDLPATGSVADVPTGVGRRSASLDLVGLEAGAIGLDPYPFADEPLELPLPTRTVPKTAFDDEDDLVEAYYAAGCEVRSLEFRPTD